MRILPGPTKSNHVLAWSPCGRWLVAGGSGDGLTAWDVAANEPGRRILPAGHGGRLMRFCPASGHLYVAFQSGGFWEWSPHTDEEREHRWPGYYHRFYGLAISPDGWLLAASIYRQERGENRTEDVGYAIGPSGQMAEVWRRPNDGRWSAEHSFAFRRGADELFGFVVPDGPPQFVRVRAADGERVGSFPLPLAGAAHGSLAYWALSPDGDRVAWLSDRGLYVRDVEGEAEPLYLPAPVAFADGSQSTRGEHRRGLAWSPDGRLLSYTTGTTVRLLDSATLGEVRALDWNIGKPRAVAFHPDGLRAAVSGDGGRGWVTVFDLE